MPCSASTTVSWSRSRRSLFHQFRMPTPPLWPPRDEPGLDPPPHPGAGRRPPAAYAIGERRTRSHRFVPVFQLLLRKRSVCEALVAKLGKGAFRLLQPGKAHAFEDARRLRELDVAVVDHLPVVSPRIDEVVVAEHRGACLACPVEGLLAVVDDEADVAISVRRLRPAGREGDELVAEVDEGHPPAATAERQLAEDLLQEGERLVDVADLDGDVVDADRAGHGTSG